MEENPSALGTGSLLGACAPDLWSLSPWDLHLIGGGGVFWGRGRFCSTPKSKESTLTRNSIPSLQLEPDCPRGIKKHPEVFPGKSASSG